MKPIMIFLLIICLGIVLAYSHPAKYHIEHKNCNELLKKYVTNYGEVNYKGFKLEKEKLNTYLQLLGENDPDKTWMESEELAYWINAYNAFTVALIVDHYPVKSIMDIEKAWDQDFIELGSKTYTLNEIEHEIIRKRFNEPRIHFALVCAAKSCPVLLNEAYHPKNLVQQLDQQVLKFINNSEKNSISVQKASVSQIFNWLKDDFTLHGNLIDYLNRYSDTKLSANAKIDFMEYDWGLNE